MDDILMDVQKRPGGVYQLSLMSGSQYIISVPLLRMHPVRQGESFSYEDYFRVHNQDALKLCAQKADYLLQNRDYSVKELETKLLQSGYPQNIVDQVNAALKRAGWLDDRKYALHYIEKRSRQYGKMRIRRELMLKGINSSIIEELLEEQNPDNALCVAKKHIEKYLKTLRETDPLKRKQKTIAMLARKGFDYGTAQEAYVLFSDT